MQKKFVKIILTLLSFIIAAHLFADIDRNTAINLVLNQIISEDNEHINVYIKNNTVTNIEGFILHKNKHIETGYNNSWIFFVDDFPSANWCHPCRYIIMDTESGNYNIVDENFYPSNEYSDFEMISPICSPPPGDPIPLDPPAYDPIDTTENSNLHAVIIGGDEVGVNMSWWYDDISFWNGVSGMYCTLLKYGYNRDNIIVHYAEGAGPDGIQDLDDPDDPTDDIDFWASKDTIMTTFANLQTILTPEDMLFVYLNDHGSYDENGHFLYLPGDDIPANRLYDHELAEYTRNINCSQMIFIIDCCFSGGFIDNLNDSIALCQNRVIQTPCQSNGSSWAERWITSPSPLLSSRYFEFIFYWTAAARKSYPYINEENTQEVIAWQEDHPAGLFPFTAYSTWSGQYGPNHDDYLDYPPDEDDDDFVQMWEIFRYANNWDSFSDDTDQIYNNQIGYFNPYDPDPIRYPMENPQQFPEEECFLNMFLTLGGISGTLDIVDLGLNPTISGNYLFTEEFRIKEGNIVTIASGSQITLSDYTNIILENGAELIIEDGASIVIGDSVTFSTPVGQTVGKLRINGSDPISCNNLQFSNCELYTSDTRLEINSGNFTNSYLEHLDETLILDNIDFNQSHILAEKRIIISNPIYVDIQNCTIQNSDTYGVFISSYPSFTVRNNNISNNAGAALHLLY
ncbi:MAG: hypothetical protein ISS80_05465 [Candidatus Cloacimonetes bacterium]|nr:hypothetical protein [Candidatus Cloacimonadota bacterium]